MTLPRKITADQTHALYDVASTRLIEHRAQTSQSEPKLMQRAGLVTAWLALALAPHAKQIWVACGPGNNGGDGFEAALALHQLGKNVCLTWIGQSETGARQPDEARHARERAQAAGLQISASAPAQFDLAIDALLGIGVGLGISKPHSPSGHLMTEWFGHMSRHGVPVLCVDLPTGLDADSGLMQDPATGGTPFELTGMHLRHTLSLLTLKPGLFTADGRDWAGQVWFDDLGVATQADMAPCALLQGADALTAKPARGRHASHKGSYGDVAILGGETSTASSTESSAKETTIPGVSSSHMSSRSSMAGAALLAARAALNAGAGRVFIALLGTGGPLSDALQPELMFRSPEALDFKKQVLVCGCGGGQAVQRYLPAVLSGAQRLVLDADALNAIAQDSSLQTLLAARCGQGLATVITPHPLEAARLMQTSTAEIQADRRGAAQSLAERFGCVVLLKGSGSVIAAPQHTTVINHSGNAWLATAGTGDVLAGLIGARLAQGLDAWTATTRACFEHGRLADDWLAERASDGGGLTASRLAQQLRP